MFEQATKERTHLRLALFGPSGSGKTFSSLRIATGLGGVIALIDTERRTARKYSDRFNFKVCDLMDRSINGYCKAIQAAASVNANVLIIDSLSHGWDELLDDVAKIAKTKYSGNQWAAWSEGTPKQKQLIETLLNFPGHIIATMRSDTEWTTDKDERTGKARPVKIGLKPRQGKGIEYEFDMLLEISPEHVATVTKDRTGKFQDQSINQPDEKFGQSLASWLADGSAPATASTDRPIVATLKALIAQHKIADTTVMEWQHKFGAHYLHEISDDNLSRIIAAVKNKYEQQPTAA